nr:hypothetical protein [Patulibacter sp. SYSU D01012]
MALDPGHRLDRAVRAALARRLPRTGDRSATATLALVGTAGVGRTTAAAALLRAHAAAGRTVLAVALGPEAHGAALTAALAADGVEPLVTEDGAAVAAARQATEPDLCVIDAAAVDPGDADGLRTLRAALEAAGVDEVHVVLPATATARACTKTLGRMASLAPAGLVMTHRDVAERPGTVLGAAVAQDLPVAYVATASGIALADPARLARLVQP